MPLRYYQNEFGKALAMIASALLSFGSVRAEDPSRLARELYEEGDWRGARREALRSSGGEPEDAWNRAIAELSARRLFPDDAERHEAVIKVINNRVDADVSAWTGLELARIVWADGRLEEAADLLMHSFLLATDRDLFLQSAYLLRVMALRYPHRVRIPDQVRLQVMTVYPLMTLAIQQAASPPARGRRGRVTARFASGGVRFYQTQISPAIGQRCSMYPSCSAYCMEACRRYGVLGIPMTADRLIRETDHVNYRMDPILMDGVEKYYDPVRAHTFWFRRYR